MVTPRDIPAPSELRARIAVADGERDPLEVRSPATGEVLGAVPRCTEADVGEAVRRARRAQVTWSQRSLDERARVILTYHDLVLDRQAGILDLMQRETGKARKHAFEEVADVANTARYYARSAEGHLRTRRRKGLAPGLTRAWEHHHPVGVVGIIAPWNYPFTLAVTDAIPALMAGNAVVLKPDEKTPFSALLAVELLYRAGLPAGLFQVVTGIGSEVGPAVVDHVDFIQFTGSTVTGRLVAERAARRLIGCSLELGGKNAMIVLSDADLDRAVDGAVRGCFANAGQLCIAFERILVQASIYDEFTDRLVAATKAERLGHAMDYGPDMGSLISQQQLDRTVEHVRDALDRGARLLAGGRHRPELGPYFFEPTILAEVTPDMTLYAEETFGPVVSLFPFESVDEAVDRANDTPYGLNASVWTRDRDFGRELATRIRTGTVNVNDSYAAAWGSVDAPMGGFKESGIGRRHGAEGIRKYTESQTVAVQRLLPVAAPAGVGDARFSGVMSRALKLLKKVRR